MLLTITVVSFAATAGTESLHVINSTQYSATITLTFHDTCPSQKVTMPAWSTTDDFIYDQGCILQSLTGYQMIQGTVYPIISPYTAGGTPYHNFVVLNDKNRDSKIVRFAYGTKEEQVQQKEASEDLVAAME